jgi:hypothetical protein
MAFPVRTAAWRGTRVGSGETSLPGGARGWPRFRTPPVTEASPTQVLRPCTGRLPALVCCRAWAVVPTTTHLDPFSRAQCQILWLVHINPSEPH